jgi:NAD(P)-dependent dehydrogenase (short-subunit alcohol dehydrogenase family)
MEEISKHGKVGLAAMRAGVDRKTARKYVKRGSCPRRWWRPGRGERARTPFAEKEVAQEAEKEGWSFRRYLHHLAELEVDERARLTGAVSKSGGALYFAVGQNAEEIATTALFLASDESSYITGTDIVRPALPLDIPVPAASR